ncbi:hypothetical protein OMR07_18395 [Methylobacterium organophilum]|nr:hypothetical protein [Methylobacterium organophilum]
MADVLLQLDEGLLRLGMAQGVAAAEVGVDVLRDLMLELLGQPQVARHQQIGTLQRSLRPPERGSERQADRYEQQGIESGERLQAHPRLA